MNIFRSNKYKVFIRLIAFIVITALLCQNVVWANDGAEKKLAAKSQVGEVAKAIKKSGRGSLKDVWRSFLVHKKHNDKERPKIDNIVLKITYSIIGLATTSVVLTFILGFYNTPPIFLIASIVVSVIVIVVTVGIIKAFRSIKSYRVIMLVLSLLYIIFSSYYLPGFNNLPHDMHRIAARIVSVFTPEAIKKEIKNISFNTPFKQTGYEGMTLSENGISNEQGEERGVVRIVKMQRDSIELDFTNTNLPSEISAKRYRSRRDKHKGDSKYIAVINGGYDMPSIRVPLDWMTIKYGQIYKPYNPHLINIQDAGVYGLGEALLVISNDGTLTIDYAERSHRQAEKNRENIRFALQCGPMIIYNGSITNKYKLNGRKGAQSAIGVDEDGNYYFFNYHAGHSFLERMQLLGLNMAEYGNFILEICEREGIKIKHVMSMDWAAMSYLHVEAKDDNQGYHQYFPPQTTPYYIFATQREPQPKGKALKKQRKVRNRKQRRNRRQRRKRHKKESPDVEEEKQKSKTGEGAGIKLHSTTILALGVTLDIVIGLPGIFTKLGLLIELLIYTPIIHKTLRSNRSAKNIIGTSRREFLKIGAVAAAAVTFTPHMLLAEESTEDMYLSKDIGGNVVFNYHNEKVLLGTDRFYNNIFRYLPQREGEAVVRFLFNSIFKYDDPVTIGSIVFALETIFQKDDRSFKECIVRKSEGVVRLGNLFGEYDNPKSIYYLLILLSDICLDKTLDISLFQDIYENHHFVYSALIKAFKNTENAAARYELCIMIMDNLSTYRSDRLKLSKILHFAGRELRAEAYEFKGSDPLDSFTFLLMLRAMDIVNGSITVRDLQIIYTNNSFALFTSDFSAARRYSLARNIELTLKRFYLPVNNRQIEKVLPLLAGIYESTQNEEILNENSSLIYAFNSDKKLGVDEKVEMLKERETNAHEVDVYVGEDKRANVLTAVENMAFNPDKNIFFFDGHGSPRHLWLVGGQPEEETINDPFLAQLLDTLVGTINVEQLGNALIKRAQNLEGENKGCLSDVVLCLSACFSGDFAVNILNYLWQAKEQQKIRDLPIIIASSNRGTYGFSYGSGMSEFYIQQVIEQDSITIGDMREYEEKTFEYEDTAFFLPISQEKFEEIKIVLGVEGQEELLPVHSEEGKYLHPSMPVVDAIGKFVEKEPIRVESGRLIGTIEHINTGETIELSLTSQERVGFDSEYFTRHIEGLRGLISRMEDTMQAEKEFILLMIDLFFSNPPEDIFVTDEGAKGFFGVGKRGLLVIDKEVLSNPISLLHEILEYLKNVEQDIDDLGFDIEDKIAGMLNKSSQSWLDNKKEKYRKEQILSYFEENLFHYIIRAFTRQVFREKDQALTTRIKALGKVDNGSLPRKLIGKPATGISYENPDEVGKEDLIARQKRSDKRKLGRNGPFITRFIPGTYFAGGSYGEISDDEIYDILTYCFELGFNAVDSADIYGFFPDNLARADRIIARINASREPDKRIFVATKIGRDIRKKDKPRNFERSYLEWALGNTLINLGQDPENPRHPIDLLQLHGPQGDDIRSSLIVLKEFKEKGLIKFAGISVNKPQEGVEAIKIAKRIGLELDSIQVIYNILEQEAAEELFPLAQKEGIGIIVRETLARGYLKDNPPSLEESEEKSSRRRKVKKHESIIEDIKTLRQIANSHGLKEVPLSHIALLFAVSHPAVTTVTIGMNKKGYVSDVAQLLDMPDLSESLLKELRAFRSKHTNPESAGISSAKREDLARRQKKITERFIDTVKVDLVNKKDKKTVLALDTDIGNMTQFEIEEMLEQIKDVCSLLGNIEFVAGAGEKLPELIDEKFSSLMDRRKIEQEDIDVVVVTKKTKEEFDSSYHITRVDDVKLGNSFSYVPILELITFALRINLEEDNGILRNELKEIYNEITGLELTDELIAQIKKGIYAIPLPPTERISIDFYNESIEILRSV